MAELTEEKVKDICRDLLDKELVDMVNRTFCKLRHETIEKEVTEMKGDNKTRDGKLDAIHKLAYGILGGIIISLVIQVVNSVK
jgi:hypothetical protein